MKSRLSALFALALRLHLSSRMQMPAQREVPSGPENANRLIKIGLKFSVAVHVQARIARAERHS